MLISQNFVPTTIRGGERLCPKCDSGFTFGRKTNENQRKLTHSKEEQSSPHQVLSHLEPSMRQNQIHCQEKDKYKKLKIEQSHVAIHKGSYESQVNKN